MRPETSSVATKMALTILKNEKTTKGSMNLKRLKAGMGLKLFVTTLGRGQ